MSIENDTQTPFYTLLKIYGRPVAQKAIVDEIDAGDIPLVELVQKYSYLYFLVKVKDIENPFVLYYKDLPLGVQIGRLSIREYLTSIENKRLPLSDDIPKHIRGEVYAWDVGSWGFEYTPIQFGIHPKANIPEEDKTDLRLYKKGLDHYYTGVHSLVSVNGFFHYHDYDSDGWIVFGGNKTKQFNKNKTHINILDFTQVGEINLKRITEDMIRPSKNGLPLSKGIYIDTKTNMINLTVGIVIGGYFHLLDHTYKRISNHMIKINFSNINWETLYYQMKQNIDISSLPITDFGNDRVLDFELYHDYTIKALLTLPQSFLVFIHNPSISVIEEQIGHTGIPKRYETGTLPIYPLRIGEGRYPAYKAIKNIDKWSIAVEDNIVPLQVRYQKAKDDSHMLHNRIYPINGEVYATAHFVRIITDRDLKIKDLDTFLENTNHDIGNLRPFMLRSTKGNIEYRKDSRIQYYIPEKIIKEDFNSDYYRPISHPFIYR